MAWLYAPTALGALALCRARRSAGIGAPAGSAGGTAAAGATSAVTAAVVSAGAAGAGSEGAATTGSGTFALWCAQATIATAANKEKIRMNGSPFLSMVPASADGDHHLTGPGFARILVASIDMRRAAWL